jgi:hypothetical protein
MSKIEIYQDNKFIGDYEINTKYRGIAYYIAVIPINPKSEDDIYFREITIMSSFAINKKYNVFDELIALPEVERMTFSKARARITIGMYDKGRDYLQEILVDSLDQPIKSVDDRIIQKTILSGLLYLRKKNPGQYEFQYIDPDGICYLLGIEKNNFLYNVGVLEENGLVGKGPTKEFSPENGGIYITSLGIDALSDLDTYKISSEKETVAGDELILINKEFKYDIVLSFAGEDRGIAENIAHRLKKNNVEVFYDDFEKSDLWGKNLYEHLMQIYSESARYCVMLLSKNYAKKSWTNLERQSAQTRAFREQREYILPIRLDDTKIPGLLETVGYINYPDHKIEEIIALILRKLKSK